MNGEMRDLPVQERRLAGSKNMMDALWSKRCQLIHGLSLFFLLVCVPAHALYTGFKDVPFYGEGESEGRVLTITFSPALQTNLLTEVHTEGVTGYFNQAQIPLLMPVDFVPRYTPLPPPQQVENITWPTFFAFTIGLANAVHILPGNAIHAEFSFTANDPLFGRFAGVKFRYHSYKTLRLSDQVVFRLIFTRIDANGTVWVIHIDLFQNPPGAEDPFTVHAFHLLVDGQIVDGFQTQAHKDAIQRAIDEKNSREQQPPEPKPEPPKEDKPDDRNSKPASKRQRDSSHLRLNHGYDGGGNMCATDVMTLSHIFLTFLKAYAVWQVTSGIYNPQGIFNK